MPDSVKRKLVESYRDKLQSEVFLIDAGKERLHDLLVTGVRLGLISDEKARQIRHQINAGKETWEAAITQLGCR